MKKRRDGLRAILMGILVMLFPFQSFAASAPAVGGLLPDFELSVPKDSADRAYLKLSGGGSFRIPQIDAQVVIIEIYSMYCPYCQAEAPSMNGLYAKIEGNPVLKGKIKIVGIGMGNTDYETKVFKKKYNVPFPLFPDGDFVIHKLLGEVRTPYFIAVKINADRSYRVIFSKLGRMESVDSFLATIVNLAGIK
jgi:peroxiredoxin